MDRESFRIALVARHEGLEYDDESGSYKFNVYLRGDTWNVILPPGYGKFGPGYRPSYQLSAEERVRILPRIVTYLSRIEYLGGLYTKSYKVKFTEECGVVDGARR